MSKRRFFQMHLSTAVVLMIVAGVLVLANVRSTKFHEFPGQYDSHFEWHAYGWPWVYDEECRWYPSRHYPKYETDQNWRAKMIPFNAVIALAILLAVWQACEWRIRRSSSKKTP